MRFRFRILAAVVLAGAVASHVIAGPLRVLYHTQSAGWEHDVVKRRDGQPSVSERVLTKLGREHGFEFTFNKDGSRITPEYLAKFDVVLFYTSGDLCSVGTDGQPVMSPAGKQALFDFVAAGKGFVGLHSTSDTFHTGQHGGGNPPILRERYRSNGPEADSFVRFLGGEFIRHGAEQAATAVVADPKFPGFAGLGGEIRATEEWYSLKNLAPDMHVLLVLQTEGMDGADYRRESFPIAWARRHGKGRVAYHAMGHREDVWESAAYQAMLAGLIEWAGGRVKADVTPNLTAAAPGANQLQPVPADVKD